MSLYFLDTSAFLNEYYAPNQKMYYCPLIIAELEHIKSTQTDNHIKFLARQTIRKLLFNNNNAYFIYYPNELKIDKYIKKHSFLSNINDNRILISAILLSKETKENVTFVTSDATQYLIAKNLGIDTFFYEPNTAPEKEEYCGWGRYYPNEQQMALLYSNPELNVLKCQINEFAEIYEGNQIKDILLWDGNHYRSLNYKEFKSVLGERIQPRNLEQKMYMDLLQNKKIPIKLCVAKFGTGKSFLALSYALHEIQQGNFDKIIFVKNNLEVKGAGHLGTLPGDEIAKQYPWLRQIEDHIGIQKFEEYLENGIIEPAHLSSLRGRDLKHCIILVDEAENLLASNIQLLLGRVAEDSQIIFCADVKQCDYPDEKMSGIPRLISCLAGNPLFGMVKLIKSERSQVSQCADLMD